MTDIRQRIIEKAASPALAVTRQALIDALVKHHVIGAREAVDRLIAAAEELAAREMAVLIRERLQERYNELGYEFSMSVSRKTIDDLLASLVSAETPTEQK